MSGLWKAIVIGLLCGCLSLVFGGEFKGNLAEPEFLAHYVGYVAYSPHSSSELVAPQFSRHNIPSAPDGFRLS